VQLLHHMLPVPDLTSSLNSACLERSTKVQHHYSTLFLLVTDFHVHMTTV